ncbi:uncharacterized protein LOC113400295 isoform X1 [Vanessa tameamea]|uniref:Uncharacterized protein LOC113400295 isoform X1 n=2 Tax=Vanessa tameamea TaxID=334116 RepID=A0A8B8IEW1_VANTA
MFSPFTWCFYNAVDDGYESFAVGSELFGRSLFNKMTVVTLPPESSHDTEADTSMQTYEQRAPTNSRLQEGQSKQVPDSRTQFIEQQLYSANHEDNVTELEPKIHTKKSPFIHQRDVKREAPRLSSAISYSRNPFDETYDESKNPFADEINDPTNPFADDVDDDDDYDKNLNPFS